MYFQICNRKTNYSAVFFFSAALFIELESLIDAQELPKNGDGLTKPGRFDFWCFVTSSLFIVARPMICFFLVYGSLLNLARTMIPFFAFRQITTDWLVFKIVLALVLDFLTTDSV